MLIGLPGPRAIDIPDIVLAELKVLVTYMKAWYAKEAAIMKSRGSDEKSYKLLAVYMYLLEKGNILGAVWSQSNLSTFFLLWVLV